MPDFSIQRYKLDIVLTEPMLGTQPADPEIVTSYLHDQAREKAKKAGFDLDEEDLREEIESLPEADANLRGTTVFHRLDGTEDPMLYDYHVKGFLKEIAGDLNRQSPVKNLKWKFGTYVFVFPRRIKLELPAGTGIDYLERPLRAQTQQGPRTALVRSEMVPEGTKLTCELHVRLPEITESLMRDVLDWGVYKGLGQWRNGGYGRFEYTLEPLGALSIRGEKVVSA